MTRAKAPSVPSDPLGVLLISGGHERAHYAFVLATAAAAIGREVTVFATNHGCRALMEDLSWAEAADALAATRGVAGLSALREAAVDLGVRLIACEAGLRLAAIDEALSKGVEVAGAVTFLEATRGGQVITL
jgi:peroxiredoxin family protein